MELKHYDNEGHGRFITFCTHNLLPLLTNDFIRNIVIDEIYNARNKYAFRLIAFVLMPEHVHLIIIPADNSKVGHVIGEIKRLSSKRIHKYFIHQKSNILEKLIIIRNGKERFAFWQRKCYDHNCRSEKSLWEKVNYCHNNPVKRGLVQSPKKWRWSSYQYYENGDMVQVKIDIID